MVLKGFVQALDALFFIHQYLGSTLEIKIPQRLGPNQEGFGTGP